MRPFARPFPISRLSLEARALYTAFLVFLLLGLASSAWLYRDSFHSLQADGAARYYRGAAPSAAAAPMLPRDSGGPALELPSDASADPGLRLEKPARQVMETFHFHLFTVPVVLLIVGHIFMLTAVRLGLKLLVLTAASVLTLLHLLAPLLIRFVSEGFSAWMPVTAVGAGLTWLPMMVWPLWEMWRPGSVAGGADEDRA